MSSKKKRSKPFKVEQKQEIPLMWDDLIELNYQTAVNCKELSTKLQNIYSTGLKTFGKDEEFDILFEGVSGAFKEIVDTLASASALHSTKDESGKITYFSGEVDIAGGQEFDLFMNTLTVYQSVGEKVTVFASTAVVSLMTKFHDLSTKQAEKVKKTTTETKEEKDGK